MGTNEEQFEQWLADKRNVLRIFNKQLRESEYGSSEHQTTLDALLLTIKDLCDVYLNATAYERLAIRDIVDRKEYVLAVLRSYSSYVSQFIYSPQEIEWLRLGLAASLIENLRGDFRDTWVELGELYKAAERHGLDPVPYFESLGVPHQIGTPIPSNAMLRFIGGRSPSQGILKSFLQSEYLKSISFKRRG